MRRTSFHTVTGAALGAALALCGQAMGQLNNPEVEPNQTKGTATAANSLGLGMSPADFITGNTTGSSTSASATSLDTYRVRTVIAPPGIYRYRLVITTTGTTGHTGTIRGLSQTAGAPDAGSDVAFQTSSSATTPPRFNEWYGFGAGEEVFYRVTGAAATSADYVATLQRTTVTPIVATGTILEGPITITREGHTNDTDFWVYDATFNAIADFGNDDPDTMTRTFAPGIYYLAVSNFNTSNNQPAATGETFLTGALLDFPSAIANSSTTTALNLSMRFTDAAGNPAVATATKTDPFQVVFIQFVVLPTGSQTNIVAAGAANPAGVNVGSPTLLTVTVVPGQNPTSSGITVSADLTSIGGSATQAFFDDATNGDVTAGDNIFSFNYTVPAATTIGPKTLPFSVADAQLRTAAGTISLLVGPVGPIIEGEPNDSKATATNATLAPGQTIFGFSTGGSGSPGPASADYFKITTAAQAGITRYRLVITSETPGHTTTIRGLTQTAGVVNAGTDDLVQTGVTTPSRFVQWYGHGGGSPDPMIYVRIAGTATTVAPYTGTLEALAVTPTDITGGSFTAGLIVITTVGQGHTTDTDIGLYDSTFTPIVDANNDDESVAGGGTGATLQSRLQRTLANGTYYIAISTFDTASNRTAPPDDDFRTGSVMDFGGVTVNDDSAAGENVAFAITDTAGTRQVAATRDGGAFDVRWFRFVVGGPAGCNPADIATNGQFEPPFSPDGQLSGADFDAFLLAFFTALVQNGLLLADIATNGQFEPPFTPDGQLSGADFDAFILLFFTAPGC